MNNITNITMMDLSGSSDYPIMDWIDAAVENKIQWQFVDFVLDNGRRQELISNGCTIRELKVSKFGGANRFIKKLNPKIDFKIVGLINPFIETGWIISKKIR